MPLPAAALGLLSFLLAGGWDVLKRELDQNKADDPGLRDWILPITAGTLGFAAAGGAVGPKALAPAFPSTTTQTYKSLGAGQVAQKALPKPPTPLMSTPRGLVRMVGPVNGKYYPPIMGGSLPPVTTVQRGVQALPGQILQIPPGASGYGSYNAPSALAWEKLMSRLWNTPWIRPD